MAYKLDNRSLVAGVCKMNLDVKNLVNAPVGATESFSVELFKEQVDEEVIAERIRGSLKLTRLEEEILASFDGTARINALCDRCAGDLDLDLSLKFGQEYLIDRKQPSDDQLTVSSHFEIDFLEPLRQEILSAIPVKKLCQTDCAGICPTCGQNFNEAKCQCGSK